MQWARLAPSRRVPGLWALTVGGQLNGSDWSKQVELAAELPAEVVRQFLRDKGVTVEVGDPSADPGRPNDRCATVPVPSSCRYNKVRQEPP
jgi:hypothetical protein